MPLLYRSMPVAEDGFPVTDWRGLGIREDHDIFIDDEGDVHSRSGGISLRRPNGRAFVPPAAIARWRLQAPDVGDLVLTARCQGEPYLKEYGCRQTDQDRMASRIGLSRSTAEHRFANELLAWRGSL